MSIPLNVSNGKFLNLKYVININIRILTIYPGFRNLVIIIGKKEFY